MNTVRTRLAAIGLSIGLAAGSMLLCGTASSASPVTFNIDSQPMGDAINAFAAQTGLQVLLRVEALPQGLTAPKVTGSLTPQVALTQLLAGTGLYFEYLDDHTVAVLSRAVASQTGPGFEGSQHDVILAQTEKTSSSAQGENRSENQKPSASSQTGSAQISEVIVTAQKRSERLQDVPISISVLGGNDLDQSSLEGVTEALSLVPGVKVTVGNQGGGTQVSVRGVSAGGPLFNGSGTVGYYLDSVPFGFVSNAVVPDSNAYDLERVEVLRGPQGTLYGASALNGVVRILTRDADLNKFGLKARTTFSSTQDGAESYRGDMAVNVPIVRGKLAARAVVGYNELGGWIDRPNANDANDAALRNTRLKINAQPTDNLTIGLSAWLVRDDYDAPSVGADGDKNPSLIDQPISTDYDVFSLKMGYESPGFSVSSMTSYIDYANLGEQDLIPYGLSGIFLTALDAKVFSQEVVVNSSHEGSWRWSAGGFYREAEDGLFQLIGPYLPVPVDFTNTSESFAAFGELTRVYFDGRFELTGGLRYFEDHVINEEDIPQSGVLTDPLIRNRNKFDAISPRVILTWHPASNSTVYGSYSEGFRSGFSQGSNIIRVAPEFPPLKEDTLKNYELGAKGTLLDNRIGYEAALYYIDWRDVQQTLQVKFGDFPFTASVNGQSASGMGFDFAVTTYPVDGLTFGVSFSWNDLAMDSAVRSFPAAGPTEGVILFDKGDRLNLSAEYTTGVLADYVFPFGRNGLEGRFSASANYSSEQVVRNMLPDGVRTVTLSDDQLIARTGFSVNSPDHWAATIFIDNVNNERGSPARNPFEPWSSRVRPRTMGVQLDYHFE